MTAIEQLCHLRDIEIDGYQARFRRTLEESCPLLPSIDTDRLARERKYVLADPDRVLAEFGSARPSLNSRTMTGTAAWTSTS